MFVFPKAEKAIEKNLMKSPRITRIQLQIWEMHLQPPSPPRPPSLEWKKSTIFSQTLKFIIPNGLL